jgi:glycine oxidase
MTTFDVAIAGGGIIGTSIALELAEAGLGVVVLDRQEPGREASWAAAGMLSPGPDAPGAVPLVPLGKDGLRRYPEFVAHVERLSGQRVPLARNGTIELFFDKGAAAGDSAEAERAAMIKQYAALGLAIEPMTLDAARKLEPAIGAEPGAAAWLPDEATVEPRALVTAVIAACKKRGVEFRASQPVTALLRDGLACTGLVSGTEKFSARHVVVAAGGFTAGMENAEADARGIANFAPTHPVRGQMLALRNSKVHLTRVLRSERAYLVPRLDGRLIAGSTLENVGFDKTVTPEGLFKIRDGVRAMVPALVDSEIIETWAGLRPGTPDGLPIIGKTSVEGLIVATGHYRNGVLLAPATAAVVRDLIVKGKAGINIEAYSPLRFSERHAAA